MLLSDVTGHFRSTKITRGVRDYAAEHGIAEETAAVVLCGLRRAVFRASVPPQMHRKGEDAVTVAARQGTVSGRGHPQLPHEDIERALAAAIAGKPDTLQDFDAREAGILVQPLRNLKRVLRHDGRAPSATGL